MLFLSFGGCDGGIISMDEVQSFFIFFAFMAFYLVFLWSIAFSAA